MTDIPSYDDLADVMSANLRVGRITATRLDGLGAAVTVLWFTIMVATIMLTVGGFLLFRKQVLR